MPSPTLLSYRAQPRLTAFNDGTSTRAVEFFEGLSRAGNQDLRPIISETKWGCEVDSGLAHHELAPRPRDTDKSKATRRSDV